MSDPSHLESAPRFGLNARELILRAFREEASGDAGFEFPSAAGLEGGSGRQDQPSLADVKLVTTGLLEAVPKAEVPVVAYVPHSRVPKVHRQSVLNRLAAEHLALALHQAGHHSDPNCIKADQALCKRALEDALKQELSLYKRASSSKQVYLNLAVRTKAYQWVEASAAACQRASANDSVAQPAQTGSDWPCAQAESDILPTKVVDELEEEIAGSQRVAVEPAAERSDNQQNISEFLHADSADEPSALRPAKRLKATASSQSLEPDGTPVAARENDCVMDNSTPAQEPQQAARKDTCDEESAPVANTPNTDRPDRQLHTGQPACGTDCCEHNLVQPTSHKLAEELSASTAMQVANHSRHDGAALVEAANTDASLSSAQQPCSTSGASTAIADGVRRFVKTCLDPLYSAKIINREVYKTVVLKVTKKVVAMHADETSASFLITHGDKVRKLVQQYVDFAAKAPL